MDRSFSMQSCKSLHPLSGALCSHMEANANDLSKWQQSIEALYQVHINLVGDPVDKWPWPRSPGRSHLNYTTPGSHQRNLPASSGTTTPEKATGSRVVALGNVSLYNNSLEDFLAGTDVLGPSCGKGKWMSSIQDTSLWEVISGKGF